MDCTDTEKHRSKAFRFGLRGVLFCCLGLVAALPVLVLGIIQVPRWEAVQLEEVDREGRFVAEALVHGIGQVVEGHVRAVETLAGQVQVRRTLDPVLLQEMVTSHRLLYGGFSFMYVAGIDGVSIVAEPASRGNGKPTAGTDYSTRDYYKKLMQTQKTVISRVQIGKNSGVPNIQIVAPIRSEAGEMIGFAEGSLDLSSIQEMADRITSGISGLKAAVLDHEGRVIVHPEPLVRKSVANLSDLPLFQPVRGNVTEIHMGVDEKGILMRASAAGVDAYGFGWTVVVYRPQAEVQTQAAAARKDVMTIAGMALFAGLGLATFLAGGLSRPIRKLAAIATDVGEGNFSNLPGLPGWWVPREMAALQRRLREMVLQLRAHTDELERKIEKRTQQLKKANQELESFVYSVSHDLKAPVISLYGMATMLKKRLGNQIDEKTEHYLQRLLSNASFMEQLITDLLDFSKAGKRTFTPEALDTNRLVKDVICQCDGKIREKNAKIRVMDPLPSVVFDYTGLCQIFLNFIVNALKFMGNQSEPTVEIGGIVADEFVTFYVKDNGIGIDPKHSHVIFGVFQRLKEVEVEGTGIGLAVVKKLIDIGGGKVWFESEKGRGTTFFFQISKTQTGFVNLDAA